MIEDNTQSWEACRARADAKEASMEDWVREFYESWSPQKPAKRESKRRESRRCSMRLLRRQSIDSSHNPQAESESSDVLNKENVLHSLENLPPFAETNEKQSEVKALDEDHYGTVWVAYEKSSPLYKRRRSSISASQSRRATLDTNRDTDGISDKENQNVNALVKEESNFSTELEKFSSDFGTFAQLNTECVTARRKRRKSFYGNKRRRRSSISSCAKQIHELRLSPLQEGNVPDSENPDPQDQVPDWLTVIDQSTADVGKGSSPPVSSGNRDLDSISIGETQDASCLSISKRKKREVQTESQFLFNLSEELKLNFGRLSQTETETEPQQQGDGFVRRFLTEDCVESPEKCRSATPDSQMCHMQRHLCSEKTPDKTDICKRDMSDFFETSLCEDGLSPPGQIWVSEDDLMGHIKRQTPEMHETPMKSSQKCEMELVNDSPQESETRVYERFAEQETEFSGAGVTTAVEMVTSPVCVTPISCSLTSANSPHSSDVTPSGVGSGEGTPQILTTPILPPSIIATPTSHLLATPTSLLMATPTERPDTPTTCASPCLSQDTSAVTMVTLAPPQLEPAPMAEEVTPTLSGDFSVSPADPSPLSSPWLEEDPLFFEATSASGSTEPVPSVSKPRRSRAGRKRKLAAGETGKDGTLSEDTEEQGQSRRSTRIRRMSMELFRKAELQEGSSSDVDSPNNENVTVPRRSRKNSKKTENLEDLYLNKLYKKPAEKLFATIYEDPEGQRALSQRRLRRSINFDMYTVPPAKAKRRAQKAAKLGYGPTVRKRRAISHNRFELKLVELQEELGDLETESP